MEYIIAIIVGILALIYASSRQTKTPPLPPSTAPQEKAIQQKLIENAVIGEKQAQIEAQLKALKRKDPTNEDPEQYWNKDKHE